jgi:hypothetical protein
MIGRLCFDMAARKRGVEHIARTRAASHVGWEMAFPQIDRSTSLVACLF